MSRFWTEWKPHVEAALKNNDTKAIGGIPYHRVQGDIGIILNEKRAHDITKEIREHNYLARTHRPGGRTPRGVWHIYVRESK